MKACYHKNMSNLPKSSKQDDSAIKKTDNTFAKAFAGAGKAGKSGGSVASKERMIGGESFDSAQDKQEKTPITEYTRKVELEPEVESWLEKLEKEEQQLQQPVTDDQGQVILDDVDDKKESKFKVVLPMTKEEMEKGLHHKVMDSVRWLAEWCVRMIKMFHGKVAYKKGK